MFPDLSLALNAATYSLDLYHLARRTCGAQDETCRTCDVDGGIDSKLLEPFTGQNCEARALGVTFPCLNKHHHYRGHYTPRAETQASMNFCLNFPPSFDVSDFWKPWSSGLKLFSKKVQWIDFFSTEWKNSIQYAFSKQSCRFHGSSLGRVWNITPMYSPQECFRGRVSTK